MELLIAVVVLAALGLAALRYGADTRPGLRDEPRRAI
jgi:hypothetical protein